MKTTNHIKTTAIAMLALAFATAGFSQPQDDCASLKEAEENMEADLIIYENLWDDIVSEGDDNKITKRKKAKNTALIAGPESESPEYFLLRPEVEKAYGYSHAVKIGNEIKISGAVSMDEDGNPTAIGDFEQQMNRAIINFETQMIMVFGELYVTFKKNNYEHIKNCYSDIEKVLKHYGCTFDDVVVENVLTTNMPLFLKHAAYRNSIYKNHFPTGSWLGVKELALPEFMIEIELEVHKPD